MSNISRTIAHLPAAKQRQLHAIVRAIRAMADIEYVILFGSHARGDWVEDIASGYVSDFDLLVLVASPALTEDHALWMDCQERVRGLTADTPVSLIVHTVEDVNQRIVRGNSFFRDVITEGIVLHDAGRVALAEVKPLTAEQHLALAQTSFPRYCECAAELYESFEFALANASHAIAAFHLHQMAEMLYKAVLLVSTAYLPKTHDLVELGRMAARAAPELGPLVPPDVSKGERLATILQAAYVEARYSPEFAITREELEAWGQYVSELRERTVRACRVHLMRLAVRRRQTTQRERRASEPRRGDSE